VRRALVAAAVVLVAGCGGEDETASTGPVTALPLAIEASVYWLRDGKVWPALRQVDGTGGGAEAALAELLGGPSEAEQADLGFSTAIPEESVQIERLDLTDGSARFASSTELPREAVAQLVYTLTQFPNVKSVEIDGASYTRADFEDQTPAILVESPLPFEEVTSPLRVTGTANTFEANFQYELTDTDGLIVDENFVTATSGTGTRGTFDFTTAPFAVKFDGIGSLIVFESSAKDGSRINLVEIPLRMTK
jgi:hypothetical protein